MALLMVASYWSMSMAANQFWTLDAGIPRFWGTRRLLGNKRKQGSCGQRHGVQSFIASRPSTTDSNCFWSECYFDVAGRCRRVHFAIHHEPCFTGGLDRRFSGASRHRRAERSHQSYLRHTTFLPVKPVIKTSIEMKTCIGPENRSWGARPPWALLDAPRVQPFGARDLPARSQLSCASEVFREGAGNCARGGRAPQVNFGCRAKNLFLQPALIGKARHSVRADGCSRCIGGT